MAKKIKTITILSLSSPSIALAIMILSLLCMETKAFALTVGPDYMRVVQPSVTTADVNNQIVSLSLSTEGNIPQQPDHFINSNILTGFGWVELQSGKVFAITIMPAISPGSASTTFYPSILNSPSQSPNTWQAHRMILTGGQIYPHDYCIASMDQNPLPNVQIAVMGNTINIQVFRDQLPFAPESFSTAVGFTLQHDVGCNSGLAMQISS